ncbi:hypothetical protein SAMN04487788_1944 [Microbacterium testaceum StLB037]|uniref:Uncharacterized protein n=1 Tax=Microbacterium testaceum (strain StLB037) TaxID=979556 RepID=A0A1H0PQC7_MICTS|nr:hypothetical protein [Microbacterium testaceum]SDP07273.1 hypothetical protein SAMN04487788_1944 [Microbacterium testaceum StLB037]
MARNPIEIPIASETGAFEKGIKSGVIEPVKDAEKALKNLAEVRGPDQLENDLRDAQRQTAKLADETDRTAKAIEKDFKRAYREAKEGADSVGDSGRAGFGKVREGAQEVTQEIGSNLGEAVSSIRGDMSDLGQVGQDTLGGLAATLASAGPAGIAGAAALAAGAVGLGLVTSELEKQGEQADRLRDRLAGAYQEAAQEGRRYLDVSQYIAEAQDLMFNTERADEWKQIQEDANTLGMDVGDVIRANAGDLEQQQRVQERINALLDEAQSKSGAGDGLANILRNAADSELAVKGLEKVSDRWGDINAVTEENARKTEIANDVVSGYYQEAIRKAGLAETATDQFGNKLYELPDGKQVVIDADTGRATDDVSRFKGDINAATQARTAMVRVNIDDSAWRNWKPGDKIGNVRTAVAPGGAGGTTWY